MSFKTWLAKKFIPSEEKLTETVVDSFADFINSQETSTSEKIEKTSNFTLKASAILNEISTLLKDGKVTSEEKIILKDKLLPYTKELYQKMLSYL